MIDQPIGRPEKEGRAPATETRLHHDAQADDTDSSAQRAWKGGNSLARIGCARQDIHSGLKRRRDGAQRLVPLDCGCRDPWPCRCTEPPLSERWIDAGREAALDLLAVGMMPMLEIEVLRALHRRGGRDRVLAQRLHQASGGVAV